MGSNIGLLSDRWRIAVDCQPTHRPIRSTWVGGSVGFAGFQSSDSTWKTHGTGELSRRKSNLQGELGRLYTISSSRWSAVPCPGHSATRVNGADRWRRNATAVEDGDAGQCPTFRRPKGLGSKASRANGINPVRSTVCDFHRFLRHHLTCGGRRRGPTRRDGRAGSCCCRQHSSPCADGEAARARHAVRRRGSVRRRQRHCTSGGVDHRLGEADGTTHRTEVDRHPAPRGRTGSPRSQQARPHTRVAAAAAQLPPTSRTTKYVAKQ